MNDVTAKIREMRIVPVVAIENADDANSLGDALILGGLPGAEITFRTDAALNAITILAKRTDLLVGAGTVLKVDQAKAAVEHGAKYIVSPGINPRVVDYCVKNNIPIMPGVCTPTDIETALDFGLDIVKFFPAEAFGGLKTLQAISAPYKMMYFLPTGGINQKNLLDYLAFSKVWACGGSWMVKSDLIASGRFDEIIRLTREAVELAAQAKLSR